MIYSLRLNMNKKLFNKEEETEMMLRNKFGDLYFMYEGIQNVLECSGVQARMPMEIHIQ